MTAQPIRRLSKPTKPTAAPVVRKTQPIVEPDFEDVEDGDAEEISENGANEEDEVFTSPQRVTRKMPVPTPKAGKSNAPVVRKQTFSPGPELAEAVAEEVQNLSDDPIPGILARLRDGESVLVAKVGNHYQLTYGASVASQVAEAAIASVPSKGRVSKTAYDDEVESDAYKAWKKDWTGLSSDDKLKTIRKSGAKWEEHTDAAVNLMRAVDAYLTHLGIEKYKEQYQTLAARKELRKQFTN